MPPHNTIRQPLGSTGGKDALQKLNRALSAIEGVAIIKQQSAPNGVTIKLSATGNTWSRAARRQKFKALSNDTFQTTTLPTTALVCQIALSHKQVEFNWILGRDRTLFESFCSHISRKVI